jgi:cytosine/uracil/thiamine/allantoin permease
MPWIFCCASKFWFSHGFNCAGVTALLAGTGVALLCVNTTVLVGPVSNLLDGADISCLTGPLVAAGIYAGMMLRARRVASSPTAAGQAVQADNLCVRSVS